MQEAGEGAASLAGAAAVGSRPAVQTSLLQSLLNPLRLRDLAATATVSAPDRAVLPAAAAGGPEAPPPSSNDHISPLGSQVSSPRPLSTAQSMSSPTQQHPGGVAPRPQPTRAATAAAPPFAALPQQQGAAAAALIPPQLHAAGSGLLQATGSAEWGKLRNVIRNPATALSSLTTRLQPG